MFHYSDDSGFKAISSQAIWTFKASRPPGGHPVGAYFTTLGPKTVNLAKRLRISKEKVAHLFSFSGEDGLQALGGGRGQFIFYSPVDYNVERGRQGYCGTTENAR